MKTEDMKGFLLARGANLKTQHDQLLANALLAEERARIYRRELAANEAAQTEIEGVLTLIDQPKPEAAS